MRLNTNRSSLLTLPLVKIYGFFCPSSASQVAKLSTPAGVSSIEMSPDGSSLFAACGRDVMLFDTQSLTLIKSHTLTRSLLCTALNRDRRYLPL